MRELLCTSHFVSDIIKDIKDRVAPDSIAALDGRAFARDYSTGLQFSLCVNCAPHYCLHT